MKYIKDIDYEYIMNKYHDQNKDFDPFNRFIRNDEIFAKKSGCAPDEIMEGIMIRDKELSQLPHPVRKGKALEYVLENTRISCDKRDIFPAINMVDRPLNKTVIALWHKETFDDFIPETGVIRSYFEYNGIAALWPDYDHSVPVWDDVFELGFCGLLERSEYARKKIKNITPEQSAFFDGIKITYGAIVSFLGRLEKQAEEDGNIRMCKALGNIKAKAPSTFYEALLTDYIYFMICEHIEGLQVRSLSNFDRVFWKYFKNDTNRGMTEEEIRTDLAYFLIQFTAIGNYWNQPVFLGGCREDESTQINDLSYIFLDVYEQMHIYNPKIHIKLADSTPKSFITKALDMIRHGSNSIVFVCDATIREALERVGCTKEQARLCDIKGCYEYSPQGAVNCETHYLNLLKPLEYALHEGSDGVTGNFFGIKSPEPDAYKTFDELFDEYKKQLGYVIEKSMEIVNSYENYLSCINPQSMVSATYSSCLEKGKDALGGGALFNESIMAFGFMANVADSLTAIKKYVYDSKRLTLSEFVKILDNNYTENERFRQQILTDRDKYGNNKELPDSIAKNISEFIVREVCGKPNAEVRGGRWNASFHVARMSYIQADCTASSPDGRLKGEELSKNLSAVMGMNREGATAAILSATKINATMFTGDACIDLGLLPSAVKGDDGLEAMYALLMTFKKRKGHAMHINVFDAQTLRAAQKEPEKYRDLQIRVCGWNVLFNNINKAEQDGFIRQAEALMG